MASPFHRGLPITFKATAVSNLLLGRRGRPLTAKFNEFRTKRCSHGLVHGKLFRKTKGFAMDLSQHFAASEVESPVGHAIPPSRGPPFCSDHLLLHWRTDSHQHFSPEPRSPCSLGVSGLIRSTASGDLIPPRTQP